MLVRVLARTTACARAPRIAAVFDRDPRIAAAGYALARRLTVHVPPAPLLTVTEERRYDTDGVEYTRGEFIQYFGTKLGEKQWQLADPRRRTSNKEGRRAYDKGVSPTAKPCIGDLVAVVEKKNYGTDVRIEGTVSRVLTKSAAHRHGFKVMLTSGVVGRCMTIMSRQ